MLAARTIPPGILGAHARDGVFHVKTAGMQSAAPDSHAVFAAKVSANFPGNPDRHGLPTIRESLRCSTPHRPALGLVRFDRDHEPAHRRGTAVAAKHLAREESTLVTVCGCGEQGRSQLRALACVRPLSRVFAFELRDGARRRFRDGHIERARYRSVSGARARRPDDRPAISG